MKKIPQNPLEFALTPNDFVTAFFDASTIQLRIILMCIAKAKLCKSSSFSFTVDEYCKLMDLKKVTSAKFNLFSNIEKLSKLQIGIHKDDTQYAFFNWFDYVVVDKDIISVKFTETIYKYIDVLKGYTSIDFKTVRKVSALATRYFLILKESRSSTLYSRLRKKSWSIRLSFEDIKDMFQIPDDAYKGRNNNFTEFIVRKPIAELNKFNLEFETSTEMIRTGRKITHVIFTCKERYSAKKIFKSDDPETKKEKTEINEQCKDLVEISLTAPELYKKLYEEESRKLQQHPLFDAMEEETKQTLIKANVYQSFKKRDALTQELEENKEKSRNTNDKQVQQKLEERNTEIIQKLDDIDQFTFDF